MGKFNGVLIASDYDGTLADSRGNIGDDVREALSYFCAEGGFFTVCTGRTKQGFHAWSPELINAPVLLANGSMAYDYAENRVVFTDCIQKKDAAVLQKLTAVFENICVEYYSERFESFALRPDDITRNHFARQSIVWSEIPEISDAMFPLVKVMAGAGANSAALQEYLRNEDTGDITFIPCEGHFVELVSRTSGKGSGLLRLAEHLHVDRKDIYSVGDGANDVAMHKAAHHAFVPANGEPLALAAADTVVRSHDEGAVAHVIEILDGMY